MTRNPTEGGIARLQVKTTIRLLSAVIITTTLSLVALIPEADAQDIPGKWAFGVRGGAALLTQNLDEDTRGKTGVIVSANVLYSLSEIFSLGLNVEWEEHRVEKILNSLDIGDATTISLIPFAQFRIPGLNGVSPYASFGIGLNINSFRDSSDIRSICSQPCSIDPENTFALKISWGIDYFVTPNVTLNPEFGWKLNDGDFDARGSVTGFEPPTDNKNNVFNMLIGIRYYF